MNFDCLIEESSGTQTRIVSPVSQVSRSQQALSQYIAGGNMSSKMYQRLVRKKCFRFAWLGSGRSGRLNGKPAKEWLLSSLERTRGPTDCLTLHSQDHSVSSICVTGGVYRDRQPTKISSKPSLQHRLEEDKCCLLELSMDTLNNFHKIEKKKGIFPNDKDFRGWMSRPDRRRAIRLMTVSPLQE